MTSRMTFRRENGASEVRSLSYRFVASGWVEDRPLQLLIGKEDWRTTDSKSRRHRPCASAAAAGLSGTVAVIRLFLLSVQKRSIPNAIRSLITTFDKLGIVFDEGRRT